MEQKSQTKLLWIKYLTAVSLIKVKRYMAVFLKALNITILFIYIIMYNPL